MSWMICGTVPDDSIGLIEGQAQWEKERLLVGDKHFPVVRGTAALAAAAALCSKELGISPPHVLLAGDSGKGAGSRALYAHLVDTLQERNLSGLTFHYLLPDVDWQLRILLGLENLPIKPLLVADAGYMYAVKMSGSAPSFDLFTPDAGELAFLADEEAPHPFYTRGFLLAGDQRPEDLIKRAVNGGGAAKNLLVKGHTDYVVIDGAMTDAVSEPSVEAMEAIGGTGDTITGLVTALLHSGIPMRRACLCAALCNRIIAELARPTPASQVADLLRHLPEALEQALLRTQSRLRP